MHCLPPFCSQPGKWCHKNSSAMQERLLQPLLSAGGTTAAGSYRRGLGVWGRAAPLSIAGTHSSPLLHASAAALLPGWIGCTQSISILEAPTAVLFPRHCFALCPVLVGQQCPKRWGVTNPGHKALKSTRTGEQGKLAFSPRLLSSLKTAFSIKPMHPVNSIYQMSA